MAEGTGAPYRVVGQRGAQGGFQLAGIELAEPQRRPDAVVGDPRAPEGLVCEDRADDRGQTGLEGGCRRPGPSVMDSGTTTAEDGVVVEVPNDADVGVI